LVADLRERIEHLPGGRLEWGVCHGDLHYGNAHRTGDQITLFDFENCGVGWRAYDLAVYLWAARIVAKEGTAWKPFLRGYTEHRALNETELQSIPLFVPARHIYLMGLTAAIGWLVGPRPARRRLLRLGAEVLEGLGDRADARITLFASG
jgi:Ser/Thr protein kinase RdoA (MazF antagonist)